MRIQLEINVSVIRCGIHTIDDPRVGGGGAGTLRCGGNGGAMLLVLTFGLRSFAIDKLFALPVPAVAGV